ncbi:MAG TPA: DNA-directed RNA polymerase subunit omega [Acidobacteriaceae bacterium]|nr:DNA-directed RNA polymerase subunit omega [Acidobacteriaceae bacterium]
MRSELIFGALTHVNNRYQLCQLASKATRKLHKPNTRLQDTMNEVLVRFREQSPAAAAQAARPEAIAVSQHQQRRAA